MDLLLEFEKFSHSLPAKSMCVPVGHPDIGMIGECHPQKGFKFKGVTPKEWRGLLNDDVRNRRKILNERGVVTNWDEVLARRASGDINDFMGYKASQTTVANAWSCFFRSGGIPGAGSYTNIPGGAVHTNLSAGAIPLRSPTGTNNNTYLLNFGVHHASGTNIVLLADLLVAAGNISANTTSPQTVNTVSQTRQYGATLGDGIMMILEVTTALGGTASNVSMSYTNSNGTSGRNTGAHAMTTSAIVFRTQPTTGGVIMPLQEGDIGVRSVESITFSAAMGGGVVALLLYKPLLLIPTLATTTYVERSIPNMLGGIILLPKDANNNIGCLFPFVLTSTTSTGVQTYFVQAVNG